MPPWALRPRRLCCLSLLLVFFACATVQDDAGPAPPAAEAPAASVLFTNKTPFTVRLVRGSGRSEEAVIPPDSSLRVSHDFTKEESYYPLFDIPLGPSYSLSRLRPEDPDWHYTVDSAKPEQEIEIVTPPGFSDTSAYIVFTNNGKKGGVSLSRNEGAGWMTGINFPEAKSNVNEGETMVYREIPRELRSLRVNPLNVGFGNMRFRPAFVYSFSFDGDTVSFIDARPLHRVGEPSWHREVPGAAFHIIEKPLSLAALAGSRLTRHRLGRNGGLEEGETLGAGKNEYVDITAIAAAGEPGRFIAAGGVDSLGGVFNDPVYTAWIGELAEDGSLLWETGLGQFETEDLNRYGPLRSLDRDTGRDLYRYCGELISWDTSWEVPRDYSMAYPLPGAYTGSFRIAEGRPVLEEAPVLFEGLSFTRIICAKDGGFYLAGKQRANGRIGALVKSLDSGGALRWEASLPGNSWYQCGFIDEEGGRIILAGTLGASASTGEGGRPFIQALAPGDGETQWLRVLEEDVFKNMNLVTSIAGAGEYGYVITLSRISGDRGGPFMAARVNDAGRYIP